MSFVGARLFLAGRLSFVGSVSSFVGGGLICGWCKLFVGGGLMFMGSDPLVGGCRSGMGGHLFVVLLLYCIIPPAILKQIPYTDIIIRLELTQGNFLNNHSSTAHR